MSLAIMPFERMYQNALKRKTSLKLKHQKLKVYKELTITFAPVVGKTVLEQQSISSN
jgi:hypothetical protein